MVARTVSPLGHGAGCACGTPAFAQVIQRLCEGPSRRSLVKRIMGTIAASSRGITQIPLASAEVQPILFTNARIFDGVASDLLEGYSVLVSGHRIDALVPAGEPVADAQAVDCRGGVLMPGLIDAHWHATLASVTLDVALTADVSYIHLIAGLEAERTLLRGFTTVRDVGGPTFGLKDAIDEGVIVGPRIFPSGAMISQTSGHGDFRLRNQLPRTTQSNLSAAEAAGVSAITDGVPEVLRATREQLMRGASQIKIMVGGGVSSVYDPLDTAQFTAAEIRAAVDAASDWGTYVCAHVYTPAGIQRAVANGVQSIEHGQLADDETVRIMAEAGVWWSLQPFLADEDANPKQSEEQWRQQQAIAEGTVRAYELGQQHGVKMAWGTDILFNPARTETQGKQLAKLVRWFSPSDVLQMATSRNAELLALSGPRTPYASPLGIIAPGALADLLVVNGNPLDDISLIADPEASFPLIMKDGRVYKDELTRARTPA